MFKREGFTEYVGDKSGGSYASGLKNIELLYGVDIDREYDRDQCQSLLAKIEQDKKRTDLSSNELHKRRDYASHLRKYRDYRQEVSQQNRYWPTLAEYDPGMTKEKWQQALQDPEVTNEKNMAMLKMMLELGGESTCAHLAEMYGNSASYYNKLGSSFGEKVKKKYNLPDCMDGEENRYFPIVFLGRYVQENGHKRYVWKLRDELKEALYSLDLEPIQLVLNQAAEINEKENGTALRQNAFNIDKNTILYGPPGTGKTYYTAIYAVAIIENKPLELVEQQAYEQVLQRYHRYQDQGRIEMTTFHQSYGYEEFIEGIKPFVEAGEEDNDSGRIGYSIEPGVFKRFCERASRTAAIGDSGYGLRDNPNIWKVSLERTGDNPTRTECLQNNHIRIGWDGYGQDITDETDFAQDGGKNVLNTFINRMQIGDVVLSCYSASVIDAIGVVTGEYEWHDEYPRFKRLRQVQWLAKDIRENILTVNGGVSMTLASVYRLTNMVLADVLQLIKKYQPAPKSMAEDRQNYVFIIDEINRGNLSKIFGELITLLEPAKRLGQPEEVLVRLPYSQKLFGIPDNIYLVGTMNTADRSLAMMDTALRRRFSFREMLPDARVLAGIYVEDIAIQDLFVRMNERIALLYDREHTIGQAYFMPLKDNPTIETLAGIFAKTIVPLLAEYFYDDYEKIRLVLGDQLKDDPAEMFITVKTPDYQGLFGQSAYDFDDRKCYEINPQAFDNIEAYRSI